MTAERPKPMTAEEWKARELAKAGPLTQAQQAALRRVLLRRAS